jgi:hypothetical protein
VTPILVQYLIPKNPLGTSLRVILIQQRKT